MTAPHSPRTNPAGPNPGRQGTAGKDVPIDPPGLPPGAEPLGAPGDRDSRGRFAAGNKGGPGNPHARQCAALRQAMLETVTPEDLQAIIRQLIQKAREGDVAAARLVLVYTVGKPDQAVNPDTLDLQEWQQFQQSSVANQDLLGLLSHVQVPLALTILRAALPAIQEATGQSLGQQLAASVPAPQPEAQPARQQPEQRNVPTSPARPATGTGTPTPETKPEGKPKPGSERDRTTPSGLPAHRTEKSRHQPAASRLAPGPAAAAAGIPPQEPDREQEQHQWLLLLLQQLARLTAAARGPTMPGQPGPPIANGFGADYPEE